MLINNQFSLIWETYLSLAVNLNSKTSYIISIFNKKFILTCQENLPKTKKVTPKILHNNILFLLQHPLKKTSKSNKLLSHPLHKLNHLLMMSMRLTKRKVKGNKNQESWKINKRTKNLLTIKKNQSRNLNKSPKKLEFLLKNQMKRIMTMSKIKMSIKLKNKKRLNQH